MAIIFVTGVSGAGKTTLYEALRKDPDLAGIEFHDIDEDGIPAAGSGAWRQFRVELLLHGAVVRQREQGKSTVICGVTKPHEAIESGAFPDDIPVHYILIDVSDSTIRKRLEARLSGHPFDHVEVSVQMNRLLSQILRKSVRGQRNGVVVDTYGSSSRTLSRLKVRQQVKQLIQDLVA